MKILAFESSCDETSVSIVQDNQVLCNIISSQYFHSKYGGVVPELASRAHLQKISELTRQALIETNSNLEDIDAIGVTTEPGLMGALLVGANFAKGLAFKYNLPIIPVNHIEGHIFSGCLQDPSVSFPFISLVVSGGHTALFYVKSYSEYEVIGLTRDDAAGEAFDKIGKIMGLEYPAGPKIDKLAQLGNPKKYDFPRSMIHSKDFNFSFSGLKTSVRYFIEKNIEQPINTIIMNDLAASVQAAIVDVLVSKTLKAAKEYEVKSIIIGGGVSANSGLRKKLYEACEKLQIGLIIPDLSYCVDNAAMIGFLAAKKYAESIKVNYYDLGFTVSATSMRASR